MTKGWEDARTILCVRLDSIGDVLMTTPALRAIKERSQERRVLLLASPGGAEIASLVPEIDEVIVYQAPWMKATPQRENSACDFKTIEGLKDMGIDGAVVFNVYSQNPLPSALLCYFADIPLRLAYCRENPYQLLTDWIPDPEPHQLIRHEVRRQLDLVSIINCRTDNENLSLQHTAQASRRVLQLLKGEGIKSGRPFLVMHPGATAPSRRYPAESFAHVARRVVLDLHMQVVFTGERTELTLIETIRTAMGVPSASLAGLLNLDEFAALIAMAPILVSNNTGPVHMAAALGTPVVDLYALTNPQHSPWNVPSRVLFHDVPCRYCYKSICPQGHNDCLRLLHPDRVIEAVLELLELPRTARSMTDA
jgi:lipopolysaccharide heptosyltransferase II